VAYQTAILFARCHDCKKASSFFQKFYKRAIAAEASYFQQDRASLSRSGD
jgi:hypothetical protein